jgi:hypothetical protein
MYAKYAYTAAATVANVMSDLVALLTGESNKANLSAGCDQANTEIIATIPAGWTLHDAAAGTNKQVLKAPFSYNGSLFKFLMLDHSLNTNTRLTLYGYETWNEVAHTGTNQTQNGTTAPHAKGSGVAGFIYVFASSKFVAITNAYSTSWGDISYGGMSIFSEYTRAAPWSVTTMPHAALIQTGACISLSPYTHVWPLKARDKTDLVLTGTGARAYLGSIGVEIPARYTSSLFFPNGGDFNIGDGLGAEYTPLFPIYAMNAPVYGIPIGDFSAAADFWLLPNNLIGNLTTFQYGGQDYIAVKCWGANTTTDSGHRIAFPKR